MAGFTVNSPVFPKSTLAFGQHQVELLAPGAPEKLYIQELAVDGKRVHKVD